MKPLHAICACLLLLGAVSCTSTRSASINHLIDSDFTSMSAGDYSAAVKAVAGATRLSYPKIDAKEDVARDAGPRAVLAHGNGAVVVSTLRGALHITLVDKDGKRQWQESLTLSKYQVGHNISMSENVDLGLSCLHIPIAMQGDQKLIFALTERGAPLIRVESATGQFAGTVFAAALPIYKYNSVKLEGSSGTDSLEALLRLSGPSAKMERSVAAVRSQLEAFSSSTHSWVAEAAAAVLILPTVQ